MDELRELYDLPVVPLRQLVIFPHMVMYFDVGRAKSVAALEYAMMNSRDVFLVAQEDATIEEPGFAHLKTVGVIAHIRQMIKLPGEQVRVLVDGVARGRLAAQSLLSDFLQCTVERALEEPLLGIKEEAHRRMAITSFTEYAQLSEKISSDVAHSIAEVPDSGQLCDAIASTALTRFEDRQEILEAFNVQERIFRLIAILDREIDILKAERRIHSRIKGQIEKNQREYYLREQIKAIHKELGEADAAGEVDEFRKKAETLPLNDEAREKLHRELDRLGRIAQNSPEYTVSRTYVEWLVELPWEKETQDNLDLRHAREVLDGDHYGLDKVKERIIEYLAVRKLTGSLKGPILCLVGPPGVGKTSIARSIATALGREFARMSLGGVRDEAEIRGHRRTYIGALPGRIITSMRSSGTRNPLILLDEIDKLAQDFRGDPGSALLEVLDSEQNNTFRDHYLDVPYDLSKVLFLTTANAQDTIPRPLLDRMEIIEVPGYTEEEKLEIAKRHLLPKQIRENGLENLPPVVAEGALRALIHGYTREAGVRALERCVARVCRRAATKAATAGEKAKPTRVTRGNVEALIGPARFRDDEQVGEPQIGVVTGLAYTPFGGDTLSIEATPMPGSGKLTLTGQLGDVMQESAKAGLSYIRSHAEALGVDPEFHKTIDLHLHVPAGATPKDGPSAGISMAGSMISALSRVPVRQDVAMTGEITLRGRVLPIGGLKEKVLAAHRAGVRRVLFPQENERDLREIPPAVRRAVELVPVSTMEEVLKQVLVKEESP